MYFIQIGFGFQKRDPPESVTSKHTLYMLLLLSPFGTAIVAKKHTFRQGQQALVTH